MRRPLKYQFMGPMAGVMLVTLMIVAALDVWLARRHARSQIERQWQEIGETLQRSSFPLTDTVLGQLRGLSGAEFLLVEERGEVRAGTTVARSADALDLIAQSAPPTALDRRVTIGGQAYYHAAISLRRPVDGGVALHLHAFYPESRYHVAWREAVAPSLAVGLTAMAVVVAVSGVLAVRVTRPATLLRERIDRIARGDYTAAPAGGRNDELGDLAHSVQRLAEMLAAYEKQVRRQEQLRTLDQLGGGMAHQLRNAVTGCRMAIDLHLRSCLQSNDESLAMALQQLELMEEYVRRFLALGRRSDEPPQPLDLTQVVARILPLVQPRLRHLGVMLEWIPPREAVQVLGDADALSQALINLVLNAAEAAAEAGTGTEGGTGAEAARVVVTLRREAGHVVLEVSDSGRGPPAEVQATLFEPLVTSKPDGAGLGLAIVREVAERHHGTVEWRRDGERTVFALQLPETNGEPRHGKTAGG